MRTPSFLSGSSSFWLPVTALVLSAAILQAAAPVNVSVNPASNPTGTPAPAGTTQLFTYTFSDLDGATTFREVQVSMSAAGGPSAANNCYFYIWASAPAPTIYLANDNGSGWAGVGGIPHPSGSLQNASCYLDLANSSALFSGSTLTVTIPITFKPAYAGQYQWYLWSRDQSLAEAGWDPRGVWSVAPGSSNPAPQLVSMAPSSGSTPSVDFVYTISDNQGANNVRQVQMLLGPRVSSASTCYVYIWVDSATFYLADNAGNLSGANVGNAGSATPISNSQCRLKLATSQLLKAGNTVTVRLSIDFFPTFGSTALRYWYVWADDSNNNVNGWSVMGTWTVPLGGGGTGPVISSLSTEVSSTRAVISWLTDTPATTQIRYRKTAVDPWLYQPAAADTRLNRSHSVAISGLLSNTPYAYEALPQSAAAQGTPGNFITATGAIRSLLAPPGDPGDPPPGGDPPIFFNVYNDDVPHTSTLGCNFACTQISSCVVSGNEVLVSVGQKTATTVAITVRATTLAEPGIRYVICYVPGGVVEPYGVRVFDKTPTVTSMSPNPIPFPSVDTPVYFTGKGFGYSPPTLEFNPPNVTYKIASGSNSPTAFTALITPASAGDYSVTVISRGNSLSGANPFQPGGPEFSSPRSVPVLLQVRATSSPLTNVRISEVSFLSDITLTRDIEGGFLPIANPVWRSSSSPDANKEVAYVRNSRVQVSARFSISPPLATAITGVTVGADIPGIGKVEVTGQTLVGSVYDFPATLSDLPLPNETAIRRSQPFNWRLSQGGAPTVAAGTSNHTIYATLNEPRAWAKPCPGCAPAANLFLIGGTSVPITLLELAIGAGGATSDSLAIANTWRSFAGPANTMSWDGLRRFKYYPEGQGFGVCRARYWEVLIAPDSGGGQCGAFASMMMAALSVNGIPSEWVRIEAICPDEPGSCADKLIVKEWGLENEPGAFFFADLRFKYAFVFNFEGDYMIPKQPGNQYGDISSLIGSPGQNSPTPSEKIFDSHFIVKAGGQFYDPSYGKGPFLSARDLELVEMYGYARNFGDLPVPGYGPLGPWRATKVDELTRISFTLVAAFSSF